MKSENAHNILSHTLHLLFAFVYMGKLRIIFANNFVSASCKSWVGERASSRSRKLLERYPLAYPLIYISVVEHMVELGRAGNKITQK